VRRVPITLADLPDQIQWEYRFENVLECERSEPQNQAISYIVKLRRGAGTRSDLWTFSARELRWKQHTLPVVPGKAVS
jgi:hypothetical protein